jgi:2-oxoglutarate dehydrogenase E2 component (dihydrolipoamide succinyltransferase)
MELREKRKASFKEKFGVSLGLTSFFVKATIGALKQFPYLNAEIQGDEIVLKKYYDVGIAVGAEEGLVVPVLREADRMSFSEIEQAIKKFAQQASEGTLSLEDLRGGTFNYERRCVRLDAKYTNTQYAAGGYFGPAQGRATTRRG